MGPRIIAAAVAECFGLHHINCCRRIAHLLFTLQDLLTRHRLMVAGYLSRNYDQASQAVCHSNAYHYSLNRPAQKAILLDTCWVMYAKV